MVWHSYSNKNVTIKTNHTDATEIESNNVATIINHDAMATKAKHDVATKNNNMTIKKN